jgi:hypothetical protein
MGSGAWSSNTYDARSAAKKAAGHDVFYYSSVTSSSPPTDWKVHEGLDAKLVAGPKSAFAGNVMRECIISEEHPDPTPIAVYFDVTGSMKNLPRILQSKLPELHGLLVRKGYCADPQIMFGAIGDAYVDRVPFQTGQFESDNRMDENLENLFLEGGGGGGNHESYDLGLYFLAKHTYLEPFEKHGKKGYAFLIGDERAYPAVNFRQAEAIIGDSLQENVPIEEVIAEVQERYNLFYLFAVQGSYDVERTLAVEADGDGARTWRALLGQNAIELPNAEAVCETIALTVGLLEGAVTLDDGLEDLEEIGTSVSVREATGKALATVGAGASEVATSSGELPGLDD